MKQSLFALLLVLGTHTQAEVINKTGKTLDACELSAVYKAAQEQGLYFGPNEATAELISIEPAFEDHAVKHYNVEMYVVFDGDDPTHQPLSLKAKANLHQGYLCALPTVKFPIVVDQTTKCVASSRFDTAAYCDETRRSFVQSLGMEYYTSRASLSPELNDVMIDFAHRRLIALRPDKFQKPRVELDGEFRVSLVKQMLNKQEFVAVEWIDIDDDSYTVFFETQFPNKMVYVYYEN